MEPERRPRLTVFSDTRPLRLLPRDGEPTCIFEWTSQQFVKALAYLPVYTAIIVTLSLIVLWMTRA